MDIETIKPDIDVWKIYRKSLEEFASKTVIHIQNMYHSFGVNVIFGRSDMQKITGLGTSRASDLLKALVHAQIIEAVTGYGKGKYKFYLELKQNLPTNTNNVKVCVELCRK